MLCHSCQQDGSAFHYELFDFAITWNKLWLIELLIEKSHVDVNWHNGRPLRKAVSYNHHALVEFLLRQDGIDPNILYRNGRNDLTGGETVLMRAIRSESIEMAELLLDCPTVDPNVSNEIWTPLHAAILTGDEVLLRKLV